MCAAGCRLHLYGFPKDPELRKKRADQVKGTQDKLEPTDHCYMYLCSKRILASGKDQSIVKHKRNTNCF